MINKADSEKTKYVELKTSSKICKKRGKFSSYIGNLISEIGEQFGDGEHRLSNIKQALNWWEKSKLAEKEFVQLLYQARALTREHTSAVTGPAAPTAKSQPDRSFNSWVTLAGIPAKNEVVTPDKSSPRNRMPYFFKVLQDLVNRPEGEATSANLPPESEAPKKQNSALHKIKKVKVLPVEGSGSQPVESKPALEPGGLEIPPGNSELPPDLARLAERFAANRDLALKGWQRWEASLHEARLKAIARRALPLERSRVRPELHSILFAAENDYPQPSNLRKEFLLVFRNAFDARQALSVLAEIKQSLEQAERCIVEVYITII